MTEFRRNVFLGRAGVVLAGAMLLSSPSVGQGAFPPVPGPFLALPGAGVVVAPQMPGMLETPQAPDTTVSHPLFQPPVNAMRVPYWMQAAPAAPQPQAPVAPDPTTQAATVPAVTTTTPQATTMPAVTTTMPQPTAATPRNGYGQMAAPGRFPGYGVAAPWTAQPTPGAAAPAYPVDPTYPAARGYPAPGGTAGAVAQGTGWTAPAWGYGAPQQGWAPTPYAPQPGWGAGWAQPAPGGVR